MRQILCIASNVKKKKFKADKNNEKFPCPYNLTV